MPEAIPQISARLDRLIPACRVCGCGDVHVDEVTDAGTLVLAECPRCDHRWTWSQPLPGAVPCVVAPAREAAA